MHDGHITLVKKAKTLADIVVVSIFVNPTQFGVTDQPDFVNAVLSAKTTLSPLALLDFCQSLEQTAGRVRLRHWGERSLDVDVLLYGDETIENERLTVPHKGLFERNFVLIPMLELAPNVVINHTRLDAIPQAHDMTGLWKL